MKHYDNNNNKVENISLNVNKLLFVSLYIWIEIPQQWQGINHLDGDLKCTVSEKKNSFSVGMIDLSGVGYCSELRKREHDFFYYKVVNLL